MLRISIITPSFNQGEFLEETIQSVLSQNYCNLQYVIIDGGSTDNSIEIIKKYEKHLSYWISEKDSGQTEAINKGLKIADGEIISWLCSDDLYLENTLSNVAGYFEQHADTSFVHGRTILFSNEKHGQIKGADAAGLPLKYFSCMPFAQPSSFFRRRVIEEQGALDERLLYGMDFDLLVRTALNYKIGQTEEIYSKYRLHRHSKSVARYERFLEDWQAVFSRLLRTIPGTENYITTLEQLHLYRAGNDTYTYNKNIVADILQSNLKEVVVDFLLSQLHGYYHVLNKEKAKNITEAVRQISPSKYDELASMRWKINYLPSSFIKLMRQIFRKI